MRAVGAQDTVVVLARVERVLRGIRPVAVRVGALQAEVLREGVGGGEVEAPALPREERLQRVVVQVRAVAVDLQAAVVRHRPVRIRVAVGVVEHGPERHRVVLGEARVQLVVALAADVSDLEARRPRQPAIEGEAPGQRARLLVVGLVDGGPAEGDLSSAQAFQLPQGRGAARLVLADAVREVEQPAVVARRVGIPVDAEAAAHDRLAGAGHVPGEADPRRHEHGHAHAARRDRGVLRVPHRSREVAGGGVGAVAARVPDHDAVSAAVVGGADPGDADAAVDREAGPDLPRVLEIAFDPVVGRVVQDLALRLVVVGHVAHEEIGERVTRAVPGPVVEGDLAVVVVAARLLVDRPAPRRAPPSRCASPTPW